MIRTTKRPVRPMWTAMRKRSHSSRSDERGLTTLEWLLIVAAVAGLAALAVVLVSSVVSETSEQIAGSSARLTAAKLAGRQITNDARLDVPDGLAADRDNDIFLEHASDYKERCERIKIVYSDIEDLTVTWSQEDATLFEDSNWSELFDDPEGEGCLVNIP